MDAHAEARELVVATNESLVLSTRECQRWAWSEWPWP